MTLVRGPRGPLGAAPQSELYAHAGTAVPGHRSSRPSSTVSGAPQRTRSSIAPTSNATATATAIAGRSVDPTEFRQYGTVGARRGGRNTGTYAPGVRATVAASAANPALDYTRTAARPRHGAGHGAPAARPGFFARMRGFVTGAPAQRGGGGGGAGSANDPWGAVGRRPHHDRRASVGPATRTYAPPQARPSTAVQPVSAGIPAPFSGGGGGAYQQRHHPSGGGGQYGEWRRVQSSGGDAHMAAAPSGGAW